ncbi:MAG: SGNH/GDSL hydrolase family protein [Actinomycetales bacterium]|nr:SGNH/GDSL hydrolase family protein [Actinomycetales bacterium]
MRRFPLRRPAPVAAVVVSTLLLTAGAVTVAASSGAATSPDLAPPVGSGRSWTGAWASSPQRLTGTTFTDKTLRLIVHPTTGGSALRIRLANTFGSEQVTFDRVGIALAASPSAAGLVPGSRRAVTFRGRASVTVRAGAKVVSDPVPLGVRHGQDLAVDLYLRNSDGEAVTGHESANQGSFVADGRHVGEVSGEAFTGSLTSWYWLDGVDVVPPRGMRGSIVALGDSITDGAYSAWNGNRRWTDDLAARIQRLPVRHRHGVLNQGIGGNRILADRTDCCGSGTSVSALKRLDTDVLAQTDVKYLIIADGINDIGYNATAEDLIAGMREIVLRAKAAGLTVIGGTITPYGCDAGCFGAEQEATRQTVNTWVRTTTLLDGVADFDLAVRDPQHPDRLLPAYDSDHLHLNDAGYEAMAAAVDLRLLR